MTRDEELTLIENAIQDGKLTKITSEQSLESYFNQMRLRSAESSKRVKRINQFGVGRRDTSKFRRI